MVMWSCEQGRNVYHVMVVGHPQTVSTDIVINTYMNPPIPAYIHPPIYAYVHAPKSHHVIQTLCMFQGMLVDVEIRENRRRGHIYIYDKSNVSALQVLRKLGGCCEIYYYYKPTQLLLKSLPGPPQISMT